MKEHHKAAKYTKFDEGLRVTHCIHHILVLGSLKVGNPYLETKPRTKYSETGYRLTTFQKRVKVGAKRKTVNGALNVRAAQPFPREWQPEGNKIKV